MSNVLNRDEALKAQEVIEQKREGGSSTIYSGGGGPGVTNANSSGELALGPKKKGTTQVGGAKGGVVRKWPEGV